MLRFSANLGFLWKDLPLTEARAARARPPASTRSSSTAPYDVPAEDAARGARARPACRSPASTRGRAMSRRARSGWRRCPGARRRRGRRSTRRSPTRDAIGAALHAGDRRQAGCEERDAGARETYLKALDHAAARRRAARHQHRDRAAQPRDVPGYFLSTTGQAAEIIAELGRGEREDPVRLLPRADQRGRPDAPAREADAADRPHPDRRGADARRAGRGRGGLRPVC